MASDNYGIIFLAPLNLIIHHNWITFYYFSLCITIPYFQCSTEDWPGVREACTDGLHLIKGSCPEQGTNCNHIHTATIPLIVILRVMPEVRMGNQRGIK